MQILSKVKLKHENDLLSHVSGPEKICMPCHCMTSSKKSKPNFCFLKSCLLQLSKAYIIILSLAPLRSKHLRRDMLCSALNANQIFSLAFLSISLTFQGSWDVIFMRILCPFLPNLNSSIYYFLFISPFCGCKLWELKQSKLNPKITSTALLLWQLSFRNFVSSRTNHAIFSLKWPKTTWAAKKCPKNHILKKKS